MSRLAGEIFSFLVIALLSCALIYTRVRQRRNRELNAWVQNKTVIYDGAVLVRQCMHPGGNWVDWSRTLGGGPRLLIRAGAIEVRAPQGMMLNSRDICALSPLSNFEEVWAALRRAGIVAASSERVPARNLSPGAADPTDALWPDRRDVPTAPRRLDIWLILPLACFAAVVLYTILTPFSAGWNIGRVAGLAVFAAVALMRVRHDRRGRPS